MSDAAERPLPLFATPVGTVILAVLLWVLSCVLAAVALLAKDFVIEVPVDSPADVLLTYALFAPSTIAAVLSAVFLLVGAIRWAVYGARSAVSMTHDRQHTTALLESINQRLLLSETAKKINYRSEDLEVLRKTLEDDIQRHEYGAAMVLVSELASTYGQLEDSEKYRARIDSARRKDQEEKIAVGIAKLESLLADRDFPAANAEAARLQRLYPDSEAVAALPRRVTAAKEQYKQEMIRALNLAAERDEIDEALEIMTVLDGLLSPAEAEPLREVARGVFGKKRDNLGVQFSVAVHDREWTQAVVAGEQIIKQFPNTRMADQVRQNIDQLRANAAGQQNVALPAGSRSPSTARPSPSGSSKPASPQTGISFTVTE